MPCHRVTWTGPNGQPVEAIVCTRGRTKRCRCGRVAPFLCDFPNGDGTTCDAPLCAKCARTVGPDSHLCHPHWKASRDEVGANP